MAARSSSFRLGAPLFMGAIHKDCDRAVLGAGSYLYRRLAFSARPLTIGAGSSSSRLLAFSSATSSGEPPYSTYSSYSSSESFYEMVYNLLLKKTKSIPVCKVENNRFCISVHFRCVEKETCRERSEEVRSELADIPGLRLTHGRMWVQVSLPLSEKVMKQMKIQSPHGKAVAITNNKKPKSCLESMKEPYRANLSADSNSEQRRCLSASSNKFDEKKANDGSLSPIVEDQNSAFINESCVKVCDVLPEKVMIHMPIQPPSATAAGSYPPPQSAVSTTDYMKLMCLVDQH